MRQRAARPVDGLGGQRLGAIEPMPLEVPHGPVGPQVRLLRDRDRELRREDGQVLLPNRGERAVHRGHRDLLEAGEGLLGPLLVRDFRAPRRDAGGQALQDRLRVPDVRAERPRCGCVGAVHLELLPGLSEFVLPQPHEVVVAFLFAGHGSLCSVDPQLLHEFRHRSSPRYPPGPRPRSASIA